VTYIVTAVAHVSPDDSRYTGCLSEAKTLGIPVYCTLLSESSKPCSFTVY